MIKTESLEASSRYYYTKHPGSQVPLTDSRDPGYQRSLIIQKHIRLRYLKTSKAVYQPAL